MTSHTRRLTTIAAAMMSVAIAGCIGPQGSHREGKSWPTAPDPPIFELYGQVRDLDSQQPIHGAKVQAGAACTLTSSDGQFTIPGLSAEYVDVVTSHAAYDTARLLVQASPGRIQLGVQLRATSTTP